MDGSQSKINLLKTFNYYNSLIVEHRGTHSKTRTHCTQMDARVCIPTHTHTHAHTHAYFIRNTTEVMCNLHVMNNLVQFMTEGQLTVRSRYIYVFIRCYMFGVHNTWASFARTMYWTDRGNHSKIHSADMDGTHHKLFKTFSSTSWPIGLAIEHNGKYSTRNACICT